MKWRSILLFFGSACVMAGSMLVQPMRAGNRQMAFGEILVIGGIVLAFAAVVCLVVHEIAG